MEIPHLRLYPSWPPLFPNLDSAKQVTKDVPYDKRTIMWCHVGGVALRLLSCECGSINVRLLNGHAAIVGAAQSPCLTGDCYAAG